MTSEFPGVPIEIDWLGDTVVIEPDGSCVFDAFDDPADVTPLNTFEGWISESVEAQPDTAGATVLESVRHEPRPAAIWRRILVVAAKSPASFAGVLQPLTWSPEALACLDISHLIGDFLKTAFALFPVEGRRRTEEAILTLPDVLAALGEGSERGRSRGERVRDRLLGCLTDDAAVSDAARARLSQLHAENAVPENVPPIGPVETVVEEWSEQAALTAQGVDSDDPANRQFNEFRKPVMEFAAGMALPATAAMVTDIETPLRELWSALQTASQHGVAPVLADLGWSDVSRAALAIISSEGLTTDAAAFQLAKEIVLAAAHHRLPESRDDTLQFDRVQAWTPPAPRVEAADGLTRMAALEETLSAEVLSAVGHLVADATPEVRFCVARGLAFLRYSAPDEMWKLAGQLLRDESTAVLSAVVGALPRMAIPGDGRVQAALEAAFERGDMARPGATELRRKCAEVSAGLYIWRGAEDSGKFVEDVIIGSLEDDPDPAEGIVRVLREPLAHGDVPGAAADIDIRSRALGLAHAVSEASTRAFRRVSEELPGTGQPLQEDDPLVMRARAVYNLLDGIASEVYFASGAFGEQRQSGLPVPSEIRQRFYVEAGALLDLLGTVPIPSVTHHVVEVLETCISFDSRGVFLRIHQAVLAGRGGAYELDSQAAQLVVKLIERYLAQYRELLQEDAECRRALVEILDIFVSAGWPAARRLTYGLHDIYR
jgi:hypothetical protein